MPRSQSGHTGSLLDVSRAQIAPGGCLILAGTPIGDARDASPALCQTLAEADVIAAEDTRLLHTLLKRLGITTSARLVSYFEGNEAARTQGLVQAMLDGARVVVATDAGMPSVSDPGYRLVVAAIEAGIRVTSVPGPSAVLTALAISGLPVDRFCFEGFLPRKGGERRRRLAELAAEPRTMVFFEAPHRLAEFLTDAAASFGAQRPGAVCREITKPYEEVIRGGLSSLVEWARDNARGEITVVVQGAGQLTADPEQALARVAELVADGVKFSSAVAQVAADTGMRRRELYDRALEAREASDG